MNHRVNLCQVLLDSTVDLELPAHKASGFVTYVYLTTKGPTSRLGKVTIPIHGRYNEPSLDGKTMTSVDIDAPELLLWNENCELKTLPSLQLYKAKKCHVQTPLSRKNVQCVMWLFLNC